MKMKAQSEEIGRVETVLASADETLGEKKKRVRVVKKIVKKKVIKKVPKRVLSVTVATNCNNELENIIASPSPSTNNDNNVPMETEKPNVVDGEDLREVENLKEVEVDGDGGKGVCLVGINDFCEKSGLLVSGSISGDDRIQTEMHNREDDDDVNNMDVEEHEGEKSSKMSDVGLSEGTEVDENDETDKVQAETSECVALEIEVGPSNVVEREDGMKEEVEERKHIDLKPSEIVEDQEGVEEVVEKRKRIDLKPSDIVEDQEGVKEVVEKRKRIDLKPSEIVEDQEGVKEVVENRETDGLRGEQGVSGETVASGWRRKQRTKIFIHGLDKDTKEEDIRKVFEEIGEVVEVKIITNLKTGKSRGFGFVRYASEGLAKSALKKYHNVEICGRPCTTAAVEGNGTILLNNIDKKWNNEYVLALLQKIGIEKIDEVEVVADPENTELNRGFAFLELQTKRDAQIAYSKLQKKNVFGKHSKIKVEWAELVADPVEEETNHIKSVYAEHIPSSWDEEEVRDRFKIFGEIESIALSKNLRSTKRSDFAFINYKSSEAALSCIQTFTCKQSTNGDVSKARVKVSLAKSIPKGKPIKTISDSAATELSKVKQKANHGKSVYMPHKPINTRVSSTSRHEDAGKGGGSSTTAELVQLLREQASWKHGGPTPTIGTSTVHHQPPSRGKQPFIQLGRESLYHLDPRTHHQTRLEIPSAAHPRSIPNSVARAPFPHYDQQRVNYTSGSFVRVEANPRYFQTRDKVTYHDGSNIVYRQTH